LTCGSAGLYSCPNLPCSSGCIIENSYGDQSGYTATASSDVFTLAGTSINVSDQVFDLITAEHGGPGQDSFEPTNVDGIMGMAYQALSALTARTPFANLVKAGILNNMFSMCMPPLIQPDLKGVLTLGADGGYHTGSYHYTALYRSTKLYYTVYLKSVALEGQNAISINPTVYNSGSIGTIVDSGTTLIILSDTAYDAVTQAFATWCDANPTVGGCSSFGTANPLTGYCYTNINPSDYPTITFLFNSAAPYTYAVLSPEYYFVPCGSTSMTIGIVNGISSGNAILGNAFMGGFEVLFDVDNSRVGFANVSSCEFSVTPTPTPTHSPSSANR